MTDTNEEKVPECEFHHVHEDTVKKIASLMPDEDSLFDLAELYKIFGDSTRIKILFALFEAELCVCDIATLIGMSMSAVSHQLRILKQAQLVQYRREGKTVFYSLADDHVRSILGQGMEHVNE
ncbi:MAG: winged helix-turn-helix transcriptional regulator [Ruminiclostridium sp.]|nr:winged helix-turn-helix transcriptional regulator [Ruminiclostridium sp.]